MDTTFISDWGTALMSSMTEAMALLFSAIPKILGFALILLVGWFVASLVERAVSALLRPRGVDDALRARVVEGCADRQRRDTHGEKRNGVARPITALERGDVQALDRSADNRDRKHHDGDIAKAHGEEPQC